MQIDALLRLVPVFQGIDTIVTPLDGGITNRNYRIDADGKAFVLRIGGDNTDLLGIDRGVEHACSIAAWHAGIGPEVIAFLPEQRGLLTRFVSGRVLTPQDMQQPALMQRVVAALRRYHHGPPGAGRFSAFETVRAYHAIGRQHGVEFPADLPAALRLLDRIEEELASEPDDGAALCPCHNDLLAANFIDDGRTIWIIDWEYAGMGDRFFDLANLAANHEFAEPHERLLLELYFGRPCREEDLLRLRLMRLASDLREAMWGFLQSGISDLDFDFLEYGRTHLQRFLDSAPTVLDEKWDRPDWQRVPAHPPSRPKM